VVQRRFDFTLVLSPRRSNRRRPWLFTPYESDIHAGSTSVAGSRPFRRGADAHPDAQLWPNLPFDNCALGDLADSRRIRAGPVWRAGNGCFTVHSLRNRGISANYELVGVVRASRPTRYSYADHSCAVRVRYNFAGPAAVACETGRLLNPETIRTDG
jgi:hypothetical protein